MEPAIGPDELLSQRAFLKRLARGLLGDELLAEDVVQEVQLRALERPPDSRASLAGWLATVTRHLALNALRARARRERHEHLAARGELVESGAEALAGIELQRQVLEAVNALREPYRTVVWLRYYEERTPTEIAQRLEVPLATIKTRLQRALAELRSGLDRTCGERRAWMALLVPLARSRATRSGVAATVAGVLAMKKVAVVLVLVALLWIGWSAWPRTARPAANQDTVTSPLVLAAPAAVDSRLPETSREPVQVASVVRAPATEAGPASLTVHVAWESDGTDAAGIGLVLWPERVERPELLAHPITTNAAGRADFAGIAPGYYTLHNDRDGQTPLALTAGEARALELVLPRGFDVAGTVLDDRGDAVAGAEIWLEARGLGMLGGRVAALSSADGSFFLRSLGSGQGLAAYRPERAPSALERVGDRLPIGGESFVRVTLVLGPEREPLHGIVLDERGRPLPGALVALGDQGNSSWLDHERWVVQVKARVLTCDESGQFHSNWALAEERAYALAPGYALGVGTRRTRESELEIRLVRGAAIEGLVRASGAPVAGAEVVVLSAGWINGECPFPLPRVVSAADGTFRLEHVPPGSVDLMVTSRDTRVLSCREQRELVDGALERWELELAPLLAISGRALDRARNALPKAGIVVSRQDGGSTFREADGQGRFVISVSDPEEVRTIELVVAGSVRARREGVRGGEEIELVADPASGAVRGRFVAAAGRVRSGEKTSALLHAEVFCPILPTAEIASDGAFVFPDVAPGRYRVSFQSAGVELAQSEWLDLADGATIDLGSIETR